MAEQGGLVSVIGKRRATGNIPAQYEVPSDFTLDEPVIPTTTPATTTGGALRIVRESQAVPSTSSRSTATTRTISTVAPSNTNRTTATTTVAPSTRVLGNETAGTSLLQRRRSNQPVASNTNVMPTTNVVTEEAPLSAGRRRLVEPTTTSSTNVAPVAGTSRRRLGQATETTTTSNTNVAPTAGTSRRRLGQPTETTSTTNVEPTATTSRRRLVEPTTTTSNTNVVTEEAPLSAGRRRLVEPAATTTTTSRRRLVQPTEEAPISAGRRRLVEPTTTSNTNVVPTAGTSRRRLDQTTTTSTSATTSRRRLVEPTTTTSTTNVVTEEAPLSAGRRRVTQPVSTSTETVNRTTTVVAEPVAPSIRRTGQQVQAVNQPQRDPILGRRESITTVSTNNNTVGSTRTSTRPTQPSVGNQLLIKTSEDIGKILGITNTKDLTSQRVIGFGSQIPVIADIVPYSSNITLEPVLPATSASVTDAYYLSRQ